MPFRSWAHAAIRSDALARVIAWRAAHSATSSHQRNRTRQAILWLNAVDDDKGRLGVTPEQLQALIAQLTARANNEHDAAEIPGSPSARRFETMRQISTQMESEGHFEFRRRSDGSVFIHMTNDGAPRRLMELMEAAGLLRDDA